MPADRDPVLVFPVAVHAVLLRGTGHPLGAYYPSTGEPVRDPDDALSEALRDFCATHEQSLRPLLETRRTQTNAVGRSAVLYPAFARVAAAVDGRVRTDLLAGFEPHGRWIEWCGA